MKTTAERSIEALTWASVVIWLGFALVAHILNYVWLIMMVLSIILLSSAIYQRSQGWHTSLSIWIFGIWMAVFSVLETVSGMLVAINDSGGLNIDLWVYLGIALVSMGVAVVFRTVQGPGTTTDRSARARRDERGYGRDYETDQRRYGPRRVDEDLSTGWIPASPQQADYGYDRSAQGQRGDAQQRSARAPQTNSYYEQPAQVGRPPQDTYGQPYDEVERYDDYEAGWTEPPTEPPQNRRSSKQRRTARPADEPSNMESRVEDIIRRSRERRSQPDGDDLPY